MTYPVEKINGYMVSGLLTPSEEKVYSYPKELMSKLKKHDYQIRVDYQNKRKLPNQQYIIDQRFIILDRLYKLLKNRYLTLKELMNEEWDFFMFVFGQEIAMLQHLFFDRKDVMLKFFEKVDFYIDDLMKTFSINNINLYTFLVSDHGFSYSPTRTLNIRVWLEQNKILKDNRTALQKIIPPIYNKIHLYGLINFKNINKTREAFQRKLTKSSDVFYKSNGIYIKKDKYSNKEYEGLRDKLIKELTNLKDPLTGEKVFQIVDRRETIYSGSYTELTPDVMALPNSNHHIAFSYDSDVLFDNIKMYLKGKHFSDMYGMFLCHGTEIEAKNIKDISILDIVPTVLHILDIPLLDDLDGKVRKDIFKKDSKLYNKEIKYPSVNINTLQEKSDIKYILEEIEI